MSDCYDESETDARLSIKALVLLRDKECPKLYLIPATAWNKPNLLLKDKDYNGLKSAPEWGINLSNKNMCLLEPFTFDTSLVNLK